MSDEILDELVDEFGKGILSSSHPHTGLSIRQCQVLFNKYGLDEAKVIIERWRRIFNGQKNKKL